MAKPLKRMKMKPEPAIKAGGKLPRGSRSGQAATEFSIVAAFVLVPLFLLIPVTGKYIDIKHSLISEARFEAWEYTVYFPDTGDHVAKGVHETQRSDPKSFQAIGDKGLELYTDADQRSGTVNFKRRDLWKDHRRQPLLSKTGTESEIESNRTPALIKISSKDPGLLNDVIIGFMWVTDKVGKINSFLGSDATFDAMKTNEYYTAETSAKVRTPAAVLSGGDETLNFTAKASVLANAWNAGGTDHAGKEAKGLVITEPLDAISGGINGVIKTINSFDGKVPGLNFHLPQMPQFGYIYPDLVPYEHIEFAKGNTAKELKTKSGVSYYADKEGSK